MIIHLADTISSIEFEEDNNENEDFIKRYENKLARELAVRVDGYQFTKPYKLGVWDGYTSTYDKTNHTFPTGLQDQVEQFNKEWQRNELLYYSYVDERGEAFLDEEDFPEELSFIKNNEQLTLRDYQYNAVKTGVLGRQGIFNLSVNSGKCKVPESMVLTSDGYKTISDILLDKGISDKDVDIREIPVDDITLINRYNNKEKPSAITVNGTKPILEVKLFNGTTQKVTHNHPLLVLTEDNQHIWKEAKDIKVGDYVVSRRNTQVFGTNNYVTPDEAYFIALMIADGYIAGEKIFSFTNDQVELLDYVENKFKTIFDGHSVSRDKSKRNNGTNITGHAKYQIKYFHDRYKIGYVTSESKEVPSYIMESPRETQLAFLSAYLETEGSFNTTNKLGSEVTSKSYKLIHDVQLMLFNLGVLSNLRVKLIKKYPDNVYYRLTMSSYSTRLLFDLLTFKTAQRNKQHKDFDIAYDNKRQHNNRDFTNPFIGKLLHEYSSTIPDFTGYNDKHLLYTRQNHVGSDYVIKAIYNNPDGYKPLENRILELANKDYYYNKVTSIEDAGVSPTFDFHMPETHSFISEGVINHNTGSSVGIINVLKPYLESNEKIAYIVPSKNIFEQALETMREQYGDKAVGYLGNGKEKLSQINVMMMQSLFSKLKEPDTGLKLTGKNREYQIFAQEIYPLFDNKTNLVANLRRFLKNYNTKGVSYKEHLKQSLLELAYSDNITDAKIKLQFNKEYVKYDKLVQKKVGNKWKKYQEYQDMVKNTKVVILDEAHHIKADTYYNTILKFTNATYKFGMTGSIDKKDKLLNLRLKAIFKDVVYRVSNQEMIDRGISAKPTVNMINITKPEGIMSKRNFTGGYINGHYDEGVYVTGIVKNDYRNKIIVNFAKALVDSGKQTLIIVNHMEHGDRITTELRKLDINVEFTHGEVDKNVRTEQMAKAKAGELDVLVATSVLDEGVDISGFRALIMAGGYKSLRLVLQRVGRILRKKETDNTALVYDFQDKFNKVLWEHSQQRLKIYQNEGFDIKYLN